MRGGTSYVYDDNDLLRTETLVKDNVTVYSRVYDMALLLPGMKCPLCGQPINKNQKVVGFGSFISNQLDPLWIFNDRCFHANCFYHHPLAEKATTRHQEFQERLLLSPRICAICNHGITNPDDYFCIYHLMENQESPLYRYNYMQLHRSCMKTWSELPYLYKLLEDLKHSGTWEGKVLDFLLTHIPHDKM